MLYFKNYWKGFLMATAKPGKTKLDLRSKPTKGAVMADIKSKLERAQKQLEEKLAAKDRAGIERVQKIIANLNATIERNS